MIDPAVDFSLLEAYERVGRDVANGKEINFLLEHDDIIQGEGYRVQGVRVLSTFLQISQGSASELETQVLCFML